MPANKLAMFSAAVCAVMLAFTDKASADATLTNWDNVAGHEDSCSIDTLPPGTPANATEIASDVNSMIAQAAGGLLTFGNETIFRASNFQFPRALPVASATRAVPGIDNTINLNVYETFTYLFPKYDSHTDYFQVWYIGGLTG